MIFPILFIIHCQILFASCWSIPLSFKSNSNVNIQNSDNEQQNFQLNTQIILDEDKSITSFSRENKNKNINQINDSEWLKIFHSEKIPSGTVRIKNPSSLGLENVTHFTGYADFEKNTKHLFFWFFESRNDPKNDPIILWLNGGPGCSSSIGLFNELGPVRIVNSTYFESNPYSWNENANVIFLDSPIDVGFSYSDINLVINSESVAKDVYTFLVLFFETFPSYKYHNLHIAGESYGGHYIPAISHEILNHTDNPFNLTSLIIGNGLTDPLVQYNYYQPMACGGEIVSGYPKVLNDEQCLDMLHRMPLCTSLIEYCYSTKNFAICDLARETCNFIAYEDYSKSGYSIYDVTANCTENPKSCDIGEDETENYLNRYDVRLAIGAETKANFSLCSDNVYFWFSLTGDWVLPSQEYITEALDNNIPVLVYAGDKDFICNWLGNQAWTNELPWKSKFSFSNSTINRWYVGNLCAGEVKNYQHFTFARMFDAGHMAPFYKPRNSLGMISQWIKGNYALNLQDM